MKDPTLDQTDRHDWFGELAERYVGYLAAREDGLEVFAAGKWTADVAILDRATKRVFRVEVRSTDRPGKKPKKKPASRLAHVAEVVAEVTLSEPPRLNVKFWHLDDQGRKLPDSRIVNPSEGDMRPWLVAHAVRSQPGGSLDSLLELSGAFCSGVTDAADRHDEYIAEGLRDDHREPSDA